MTQKQVHTCTHSRLDDSETVHTCTHSRLDDPETSTYMYSQ